MQSKIEKALKGLKDFQLATVDYVYKQLYVDGRNKMLIADEVGLGKTIVAKGLIAKAFERSLKQNPEKRFNVVYVCSNLAIARQNLTKLNFIDDKKVVEYRTEDDRITSLAYIRANEIANTQISIRAFTPATSFDDKTHAGRWDERVLLYRLLFQYADLEPYKNSLKWILKGSGKMNDSTWEYRIWEVEKAGKEESGLRTLRPDVRKLFRERLEQDVTSNTLPKSFRRINDKGDTTRYSTLKYWTLLKKLAELDFRKNTSREDLYFVKELISHLRLVLSRVCIDFLDANMFILDEFQRYKNLINDDTAETTPAVELVRAIFNRTESKILMLSATPFKAYTNDFDEINGEVHQKEFEVVLRFLNKERPVRFWKDYEELRNKHFAMLRHPQKFAANASELIAVKNDLERFYRSCIVRTERLSVSEDQNALIKSIGMDKYLDVNVEDISDFVGLDRITQRLNKVHKAGLSAPIEYIKSSPFALSFLDNYQHKKKLKRAIQSDSELENLLKEHRHIWVDLKAVAEYKDLLGVGGATFPNARLRALADETIKNGGWKLLWIPPALPYYPFESPYVGMAHYSKTLVFSSWILVPKMISTLISYEVERLSIANPAAESETEPGEKKEYFAKQRTPRPQITYKIEDEQVTQPGNIIYTYPALGLAKLYDPATNLSGKQTLEEIKKALKLKIKAILISPEVKKYSTAKGGNVEKWYWAAPLLIDKVSKHSEFMGEWLAKQMPKSDTLLDAENAIPQQDDKSGKAKYFSHIAEFYKNPQTIRLPELSDSQLDDVSAYVVSLALGSPSICYLRTQLRYDELSSALLDMAFEVASAFITLFNKPESISVVKATIPTGHYLEKVLAYSIAGNLQAMLDEYVYLTRELGGTSDPREVSDIVTDILSIRTARTDVDGLESFLASAKNSESTHKKAIRTHFASDFGSQKLSTAKSSERQVNIRQAFNSPFRPFVLATTSVGQEGLDFHLYCRKIFHWNLPSNAIDLEQREGRINRYMGLVIRQNLVAKYANQLNSVGNAWEELFKAAESKEGRGVGKCEIIPFWHTEATKNIKIERHVPLYPFSRDIAKYKNLLKVLVYYRLTFGHSRQEELVETLADKCSDASMQDLKKLLINLSPFFQKDNL